MRRQSRAHAGGHPPSAHTLDGRDWREIIIVTAIACGCLLGLTGCAADEQTQGAGSENTADSATDRETRPPAAEQGRDGAPTPVTLRGSVTDVVDGDTIKVVSRGFETTVRLLGIDTPETRRPGGFVQCFGPAASARTRRLLANGQDVRLVTDVSQDRRDRYGRLLAYVYKPGRSGATGSVNHALVATGYAKVYIYRGNRFRHAGPFEEAEARARRRAIGLWGAPCRGNTTKRDPATIPPPSPSPLAGATSAEARFSRLQPRRRLWQGTAIFQAFPDAPGRIRTCDHRLRSASSRSTPPRGLCRRPRQQRRADAEIRRGDNVEALGRGAVGGGAAGRPAARRRPLHAGPLSAHSSSPSG